MKIEASIFIRNEACKGGGLYIGMSNKWSIGYPHNSSTGQVVALRVVIDTCTFNENSADFGGGLMTELRDSTLDSSSSVTILVFNSTFNKNHAINEGAGVCLHHLNIAINYGGTAIINVSDTYFKENSNEEGTGAGIGVKLASLSLVSHASWTTVVNNCSFASNRPFTTHEGGGIYTWLKSCFVESNSFLSLQTRRSTFTSNGAWHEGAGIYTQVVSCSLHSNSWLIIQTAGSTFTSNHASNAGAGIYTWVQSSVLDSNSSLILETVGSTFIDNHAKYGAGIWTEVQACSIHFNSSIQLHTKDSTFSLNTGVSQTAGIYTLLGSCSVDSHSSFILQTTDSTFTNNKAFYGTGIKTEVESFSVNSNSLLMLQTNGSMFSSNTATWQGAGIEIRIKSCSVYSYSSIIFKKTHSNFILNTADRGAGIYTEVKSCSLDSNSLFMLQISDCNFSENTAKKYGAGIYQGMISCSVDSTSSFTQQMNDSSFLSNKADRGAGIFVQHDSKKPLSLCIPGDIALAIYGCRFLNNSASREGGSLHFKVFLITHVIVSKTVFESNHALPGSGLYRENIECDSAASDHNTESLITTQIFLCYFTDNIDTAILVRSKERYGILEITNCSLINNRCINSFFAEDIFTEMDLELKHTIILKDKTSTRIMGINSQFDAKLENVTMNTTNLLHHRQISIAMISHLITQKDISSFEYHCPAFYQPMLSIAGLSETGAAMVRATCDACFEGYYTGKTGLVISNENHDDYHCDEKQLYDKFDQLLGKNLFCYTKSIGTCNECPHGANCTAGVVALPNYWGHMTAANRLEFHRCPVGYCCNRTPCAGINQCSANREGTLCGRCTEGFTESLLSQECLPDEECDDTWVQPLFISWAFCVALAIVFMGELEKLPHKILERCKHYQCKKGQKQENQRANASDRNSDTESTNQEAMAGMKQIGLQVTPKVPILWGLLTTERQENADQSGHLKYLQIVLYYIQDSALFQVDLALGSKGNLIRKIRRLLLNVSQMAVDLLDLGLKLCPIKGWTPVQKIMAKNLTGPLVFFFIVTIYSKIKLACCCFPGKRHSIKRFWYPKVTSAVIFSILLFYQQIANTTFSLLYCIESDDQSILFIDGTVTCYQLWQIVILIFAINWIVAIIPVLMFLPGLLELRLIGVKHFFLACLLPGPMLVYWGYRIYKEKFSVHTAFRTPWQDEALALLQKTFVKTTYKNIFPFCWIGFMKIRRLALVLIYTFVNNLVGRVSLMCFVIVLFLVLHLKTLPYQDAIANEAYTASMLATLGIGFINIMKATCVEFYLDLGKVKHSLETLDMITDAIFVYCPPAFIILTILGVVWGNIRISMRKKVTRQDIAKAPVVTEDDL